MLTDKQLEITKYNQNIYTCYGHFSPSKVHFLNEIFYRDQMERYNSKSLIFYQGSVEKNPMQTISGSFGDAVDTKYKVIFIRDFLLKSSTSFGFSSPYSSCLEQSFRRCEWFNDINITLFLGKTIFANIDYCGSCSVEMTARLYIRKYIDYKNHYLYAEHNDWAETLFFQNKIKYLEKKLKKLRINSASSNQEEEENGPNL